ncbi:MAG TPA: DUF3182 family protein [Castellaniella sp.]|nr:DUF3182 family protein [Castellaniella sp.]
MNPSALPLFPVQTLAYPRHRHASEHELASQGHLALRIARLLGWDVFGPGRLGRPTGGSQYYYVPDRTLTGPWRSRVLGILNEGHLFGGVVPHGFVATKAISHGLWDRSSHAPQGWVHALGATLQDVVLPGFAAYDTREAYQAGLFLLQRGPVRIKALQANAGRGQRLVQNAQALAAALQDAELCAHGVVLEENLDELVTYSVGWCRIGDHALAYVGTQSLTTDNQRHTVYGGSMLRCVRGGPEALSQLELPADHARAVRLAIQYDAAVGAAYPALFASRRNYDVAIGETRDARPCAGVLEQSWRAGGASPAELAALHFLSLHPEEAEVTSFTRERYGESAPVPAGLECIYRGVDRAVGPITKMVGIVGQDHGA